MSFLPPQKNVHARRSNVNVWIYSVDESHYTQTDPEREKVRKASVVFVFVFSVE